MSRIISPSILSADFGKLTAEVEMLNQSEAEWIHIDVMDGLFVPNISFGFPVMSAIRCATTKVLDTHLMIVNPENYIDKFAKAGADIITIHSEATPNLEEAIEQIKRTGAKAGVSVKPNTPLSDIEALLPKLDLVLIMSVEPGFGGQSFIDGSLEKIAELRRLIDACGSHTVLEVDGGVTTQNAAAIFNAGADALVAGNAVFATEDPIKTIHNLLTTQLV